MRFQGHSRWIFPLTLCAASRLFGAENIDPQLSTELNNLGSASFELGQYRDAERYFERSLEVRRELGDLTSQEAVRTLGNLAMAEMKLNLLTKAEGTLERASRIEHDDLAAAKLWLSLGAVYEAEGRWTDAEELFRKVLTVRECELGPSHPDVAIALNNLGVFLENRKRFEAAGPLLERAVDIWRNDLGPDHPSLAAGYSNLGVLYTSLDRFQLAEDYFQRAIRIASAALPPDHPNLAAYRTSYAFLLRKLGRKAEAKKLDQAAQEARESQARNNLSGYTVDAHQFSR